MKEAMVMTGALMEKSSKMKLMMTKRMMMMKRMTELMMVAPPTLAGQRPWQRSWQRKPLQAKAPSS